ncbi:MAG: GH32 C-terminal domain-containing protein [Bacteroidales bacterium]|nr:GH32 C-terminal domain-containing protein [Bacteroidales bacterium]
MMKRKHTITFILILLILTAGRINAQHDTLAHWSFDAIENLEMSETASGNTFEINSNWDAAETVTGVNNGMAMRTDGYSVWSDGMLASELPSDQFTYSGWFALESYPVNTAGFIARYNGDANTGFMIGVDKFGQLVNIISINETFHTFLSDVRVNKFEWLHFTTTIDTLSKEIKTYLNGELVINKTLPEGAITWPESMKIYLGRWNRNETVGIFPTNLINGLLDEITLQQGILSQNDIQTIYQSQLPEIEPNLAIPESRFEGDFHRPIYHAIPPSAWTNEPHGLVYHDGLYHIFYQKNANGPYWSQINWGHQCSPDLITWTEEKPVLSPEPGYDQVGIWSGDCVINEGEPTIMYTGVDGVKATMDIATSSDNMLEWEKYPQNPVVDHPPTTYNHMDFRDPFFWQDGNTWYMIIGSGIQGTGGTVFMYKSDDFYNWEFIRPLFIGHDNEDNSGIFWEMPVFMKFGDKRVLLVNKVPEPNAPANALYWVGEFINERFFPDHEMPKKLEIINHLLSPTVTTDTEGREVGIGIIPDHLPAEENYENGWAHLYSLPRVYYLKDNEKLAQKPHPDLVKLRGEHHHFENIEVVQHEENYLDGLSGRNMEIKAIIDPGDAGKVGIILGKSPNEEELTKIYYDFTFDSFVVDLNQASTNPNVPAGTKTGEYELPQDKPFEMRVFIDGSVVEVFINEESAFTTRIFPELENSTGIDLFAEGGTATGIKVDAWEMLDMHAPNLGIGDSKDKTGNIINLVRPNPFMDQINFELKIPEPSQVELIIYNILGKQVDKISAGQGVSGNQQITWDGRNAVGKDLSPQIFIAELKVDGKTRGVEKIIKK